MLNLGEQDGFIRESVKVFVVVMIIFVILLDGHALFDNRREAGDDAHVAAMAAALVYSTTQNDALAKQQAERVLDERDAQLVAFAGQHVEGDTYYTVTATRAANTYLFHYLASVPGVGSWAEKLSHPDVSSYNDSY
jgi:uncharacterized membrane protein